MSNFKIKDALARDHMGRFEIDYKVQDEINRMNRPLTERENSMIEQFIKKQKEKDKK